MHFFTVLPDDIIYMYMYMYMYIVLLDKGCLNNVQVL